MNDLIAINYENEKPTVSGRELHEKLEITTPYHKWFPRMVTYGFAENKDYLLVGQICSTNNPKNPTTTRIDHALSLSMAKELCMLQRSEKGKRFRKYFISCEEAWNSPEKIMERAWQIAHARAVEAERQIFALSETNETLEIALNESLFLRKKRSRTPC
jgi:anti-repressor protein